jgi:integrase
MSFTPSYRLHKPSGRAVVTIHGKHHYLGPYGSAESKLKYKELIRGFLDPGYTPPVKRGKAPTISELLPLYYSYIDSYYVKNGQQTHQVSLIKLACKVLEECFGKSEAGSFGPLKLKTCRDMFILKGLCRNECNRRTILIKQFFQWLCENEMIPPTVYHGLESVKNLQQGRSAAPDHDPVAPVADDHITVVLSHVSEQVALMIDLQRTTGMRPNEVVSMSKYCLDMSQAQWLYTPIHHKTEHHGKARVIPLNDRLQQALTPLLLRSPTGPLFRPIDAHKGHHGQARSPKSKAEGFTVVSYRQAIWRACKKAGIPNWSPNQLRHKGLTEIRDEFGLDGARAVGGHSKITTTENYTREQDLAKARDITRKRG